ncbi:Clr6 histone deacetylase associated PHD protein- 1 Cph1 [Schizosaccharomyces cryophilus OY26]|uniref:Clr6 histone deacetylase associated PHD protein-1 Cph1 n=1 Tax=Schizosaccharomyces cryophilus (strain OY26 / ATCC MYA-4695 / CBS 11777 / NBRC 106824 / NRRL Y48691) TaxID=653667 RepID=S9XK35_SCHCR|nr:Clr6 histone deacetylase associated PHD protein- 1 Cph1 [Schizosaccharomyces cryophilus OY26]EPY54066.1 Clr6 histone deacetylase associated PHD protein- 1 Cph1 [Schizosaccharomyces cryophilus OY26]
MESPVSSSSKVENETKDSSVKSETPTRPSPKASSKRSGRSDSSPSKGSAKESQNQPSAKSHASSATLPISSSTAKKRKRRTIIKNVDYCSACGGRGLFLCCEACPRSFHLTCLDPPLIEDEIPDGSWYCTSCSLTQHVPPKQPLGLWSQLFDWVDSANVSQYSLPDAVIHHFHGLSRDPTGKYEEQEGQISPEELSSLPKDSSITSLAYCGHCSKPSMGACKVFGCQVCDTFYHTTCFKHAKACHHDVPSKLGLRVPRNAVVVRTPALPDKTIPSDTPPLIAGWQFAVKEEPSDDNCVNFPRLPVSCLYKVSVDGLIKDFLYTVQQQNKGLEKSRRMEGNIQPTLRSTLMTKRNHPKLPQTLRKMFLHSQ